MLNSFLRFEFNQGRDFESDYLASLLVGSYFSAYRQFCVALTVLGLAHTVNQELDWWLPFTGAQLSLLLILSYFGDIFAHFPSIDCETMILILMLICWICSPLTIMISAIIRADSVKGTP